MAGAFAVEDAAGTGASSDALDPVAIEDPAATSSDMGGGYSAGNAADGLWGGVNFVQLESTDGSAILVEWELNAESLGLEVAHYELQWRPVQETPWDGTPAASKLPISKVTKKNLQPDASYQFRVRACDSSGHWLPFTETAVAIRPDGSEPEAPPISRAKHLSALAAQRTQLVTEREKKIAEVRQEFADRMLELDEWKRRCLAAEKAIDPEEQRRQFLLAKEEARVEVEREAEAKVGVVMRNAALEIRDRVASAEARTDATVERAVGETTKRLEEKAAIDKRNALRKMEEAYDARLVALQTRLGAGAQQHAQYLEGRHREETNRAVQAALVAAERAASQRQARAVEEAVETSLQEKESGSSYALEQLAQQVMSLKHQLALASRGQSAAESQINDDIRRHREELKAAAAAAAAEAKAQAAELYKPQIELLKARIEAQAVAYASSREQAVEFNRMLEETNYTDEPESEDERSADGAGVNGPEPLYDSFESTSALVLSDPQTRRLAASSAEQHAMQARLAKASAAVKKLDERLEHALAEPQTATNEEAARLISDNLRSAWGELESAQDALSILSLALACQPIAAAASAFSIAVDWPAIAGASKYHLQWREAGDARWMDSKASEELKSSCCTKAGLRTLAVYEFRVRAGDAQGEWGPWSAISELASPSLTLDKAPSRPLVKTLSGGRVKLSWAPPNVSASVLRYELQWKEVRTPRWTEADTVTVAKTEYVTQGFFHLSSVYVFRVRAELNTQPKARWTEFGPCSGPVQPALSEGPPTPSQAARPIEDVGRRVEPAPQRQAPPEPRAAAALAVADKRRTLALD
jgi:chitodextrinase